MFFISAYYVYASSVLYPAHGQFLFGLNNDDMCIPKYSIMFYNKMWSWKYIRCRSQQTHVEMFVFGMCFFFLQQKFEEKNNNDIIIYSSLALLITFTSVYTIVFRAVGCIWFVVCCLSRALYDLEKNKKAPYPLDGSRLLLPI